MATTKKLKKNVNNELPVGARYICGNLRMKDPNPANPNPQHNGDYPKSEPSGPYYQFITTDLNEKRWLGSALIFHRISLPRPEIELHRFGEKVDCDYCMLYDNLFDMRIYRINISIPLHDGDGDDEIKWKINWGDHITQGSFYIARYNQKWRGGFFSCNGFDATVSQKKRDKFEREHVWQHLHSIHAKKPLHLLIWGGDQIYMDDMFERIPYLKVWVEMEWNTKWTCDFSDVFKEQVERYYFSRYVESWERPEAKKALESIPSVMMWDDHEIFDGAGSYPRLLHDSPMMCGLFNLAQKMRLLFQHHTTVEKAREHYLFGCQGCDHHLFGCQGYNFLTCCGPNLAILGCDGRTERNDKRVQCSRTWDMIFETLEQRIINIPHLIVVFPTPFTYVRYTCGGWLLKIFKNCPIFRQLPLFKRCYTKEFGLPEHYDDHLDTWTHSKHIAERNRQLERFQEIARIKTIRITFFSGDIHYCGIGRFKTGGRTGIPEIYDSKLMYQIISSPIANVPPSPVLVFYAYLGRRKWHPIENTDTVEEFINHFEYSPEGCRRPMLNKFLGRRNWCYFEQSDEIDPSLKIQLWIESRPVRRRRVFASYPLLIPNLTDKSSTLSPSPSPSPSPTLKNYFHHIGGLRT